MIRALIVVIFFSISFSAFAEKLTLKQKLAACSVVLEDSKRLRCFDQVANNLPKAGHQAKNEFGLERKIAKEKASLEAITSSIVKLKKSPHGQYRIELENGQKWHQVDTSKLKLKQGDVVTIKRGQFGAFKLSKPGVNRQMKVKRKK